MAVAVAYLAGAETLGFVLVVPLVLVAAIVATTNWCVPSLIYGLLGQRRLRGSTA